MDYIRKTYGVPAKRGGRVTYSGGIKPVGGTICAAASSGHLLIRLDGEKRTRRFHPDWKLTYEAAP